MDAKKCGWLFLSMLLLEFVSTLLLIRFSDLISMGIIESLIFSQLIILVPAAAFLLVTREHVDSYIALSRPNLTTSLLVIVLTYLCMPLIITVNAVSMLFVDNEAAVLQGYLAQVPAWQVILMVGLLGPISEEFVFRGVFYQGFRRSGRVLAAILVSAILFGLTHLNFNQMSYAIVMGVIGTLLIEGCGSIFYSMLVHVCINTTNALEMVLIDSPVADMQTSRMLVEQTMHMPYKQALCVMISVMAVFAAGATALAACLFWAIVKKEGRTEHMRALFARKEAEEGRGRIFSVPLILGMVMCLVYMVADVCLKRM